MMNIELIIRENLGPPTNMERIIRAIGVQLDRNASLAECISGQTENIGDGKYKISTNKNDHYYRKRFTMAHELGHFLYHSHLIGDGVDDNRAYRNTQDGQFYNPLIGRREETEANKFAASILMPSELVEEERAEGGDVAALAKKFQVSRQAMEIRLDGLNRPIPAE